MMKVTNESRSFRPHLQVTKSLVQLSKVRLPGFFQRELSDTFVSCGEKHTKHDKNSDSFAVKVTRIPSTYRPVPVRGVTLLYFDDSRST